MQTRKRAWAEWLFGETTPRRRPRTTALSCDTLEGRVTPAHFGFGGHAVAAIGGFGGDGHGFGGGHSFGTSSGTSTSTTNTALQTALKTLHTDVQTIESASGTTVGELTTIRTTSQTLHTDGLKPTSQSALTTFENTLVTTFASGTAVTGNATLLAQYEALYTSTPTTQQTTDLTAAYNALAAAVTSSGITSANITTINTDYAAVLAAQGGTSTSTYPYFTLVTGGGAGGFGGC